MQSPRLALFFSFIRPVVTLKTDVLVLIFLSFSSYDISKELFDNFYHISFPDISNFKCVVLPVYFIIFKRQIEILKYWVGVTVG